MRKISSSILSICLFLNVVHATDIPFEHVNVMNSALVDVFNVSEAESIERLLKGMSSPGLYKISVEGKAYVVRFCNINRSLEDKQRELDAMLSASKRGLAPKVIYSNLEDGLIIMDYIDPTPTNPLSQDSLRLLGSGMRQIHEGPTFGRSASIFDVAKYFESLMSGSKPTVVTKASELLKELALELQPFLVEKPCHHDINPNNILYSDGKIYFIDWELAGQGDPFFDLATPVILYSMDQNQEDAVLHAYFGRSPLHEELIKFEKMKTVAMIYYGFALVAISQARGEAPVSDEEIQSLPSPRELAREGDKIFPKGMQRYGLALLLKAIKPLNQ
jgi:hypothetical protein